MSFSLSRSLVAIVTLLALSADSSSALPFRRANSLVSSASAAINADCDATVTVTLNAASTTIANTAATSVSTSSPSAIGNFGSCSIPQIKFGVGFDNRKETSFEPADQTSYPHGSADNIDIITQFICDELVNTCGADQTAQNTCASAQTAADTVTAGTGGQADAFNAVFGINTDFASVAQVDDQGNVVGGSTGAVTSTAAPVITAAPTAAASSVAPVAAATTAATATAASSSGIGNFGSCSVPEIQFGTGFDGRKETSFEPVDQTSYNHGSADNIGVITQFICNTLTNTCGADQTAKDTCTTATNAANAAAAKTGAQADAFNAVFGITTDFAAVAEVDDTGKVVSGSGADATASAAASTDVVAPTFTAANTAVATVTSAPPAATSASTASGASAANLQTFTGNLGGVAPPAVTALGNGQFQVDGNSAFNNLQNALARSCDVQNNQCADAANASGNQGDLTVAACGQQQTQCDATTTASASA